MRYYPGEERQPGSGAFRPVSFVGDVELLVPVLGEEFGQAGESWCAVNEPEVYPTKDFRVEQAVGGGHEGIVVYGDFADCAPSGEHAARAGDELFVAAGSFGEGMAGAGAVEAGLVEVLEELEVHGDFDGGVVSGLLPAEAAGEFERGLETLAETSCGGDGSGSGAFVAILMSQGVKIHGAKSFQSGS